MNKDKEEYTSKTYTWWRKKKGFKLCYHRGDVCVISTSMTNSISIYKDGGIAMYDCR